MRVTSEPNKKEMFISLLLRSGLAIVFIYAALSAFFNPLNWVGFIPAFLDSIVSREILLIIFSTFEILLGFGLLANYKTFTLSIISSAVILLIIGGNIFALDILFRDIAILFMALALVVLSYKKWQKNL